MIKKVKPRYPSCACPILFIILVFNFKTKTMHETDDSDYELTIQCAQKKPSYSIQKDSGCQISAIKPKAMIVDLVSCFLFIGVIDFVCKHNFFICIAEVLTLV